MPGPGKGVDEGAVVGLALQGLPMGRLPRLEEIAHLLVCIASKESEGTAGQSIPADGGMLFV